MKKGIILYYSYGGNTKSIAKIIQENTDFDIVEIEPIIPYTTDYKKLVDEEERKMNDHEIVQPKPIDIDFNDYEKIVIGVPVWWYTFPSVIRGFLTNYNLKEKNVDLFITNGGWIGHTVKDFKNYLNVKSYINIKFNGNNLVTSREDINDWIKKI